MKRKSGIFLLCLTLALSGTTSLAAAVEHVLLEAEQFADLGGWDLDQQSMDVMGSPYLLAHGLGVPVKDAGTKARFPSSGAYRVWVRTRDWVAPWKAPGAPGKFQLLVNGKPLAETFGTKGAEWHWQDGGEVEVGNEVTIALHDLTGFEGRCDAVLFCKDPAFTPPNETSALARFRRAALGLTEEPEDGGDFDLVVVGGGIAGTSAAVSAARNGLRVALVQDRPVLGGNGSSEVRVWPEGNTRQKPYPHVGDIVEELVPAKRPGIGNARQGEIYEDQRKLDVARAEPRITLLTEHRVYAVTAREGRIQAVNAQHIRTAKRVRLKASLFADCTGDATMGFLAGADYEYSREEHQGASNLWNLMDASDPAQVLKCECKDKDALTISVKEGKVAAPFPRCPWAVDLSDKPFPGRKNFKGQWADLPLSNLGGWFWESGFQLDMVSDIERIRDQNFRAMYGAWDVLKNVDKLYPNHRLGWAAFIAGKRESRRLIGDAILTGDDFRDGREFPDGCFPCSWPIDIHTPHPDFDEGFKGEEFISRATTGTGFAYKGPYWAPYRCLYSRNVTNLFMAGRDISVPREGLGPVRVMKTCGMMGEIVGKAAWICVRHGTSPRGVYEKHLPLLKELMSQPGAMRREQLDGVLSMPSSAKPTAGAASPIKSTADYDFNAMLKLLPATAKFSDPDFNIWLAGQGSVTGGGIEQLDAEVLELNLHRRARVHLEGNDAVFGGHARLLIRHLAHYNVINLQSDFRSAGDDGVGVPLAHFHLAEQRRAQGKTPARGSASGNEFLHSFWDSEGRHGLLAVLVDDDLFATHSNTAAGMLKEATEPLITILHVCPVSRSVPVRKLAAAKLDTGVGARSLQPELGSHFEIPRLAASPHKVVGLFAGLFRCALRRDRAVLDAPRPPAGPPNRPNPAR